MNRNYFTTSYTQTGTLGHLGRAGTHAARWLAVALALLGLLTLSTAQAHAAQAPTHYGGADYYALVHDCVGSACARVADWAAAEQPLRQLFRDEGWGRDSAVASRQDAQTLPWAQWAAAHLFYIDEQPSAARRNAIALLRADLGRDAVLHVIRVGSR
jgi:hypothetical protein